MRINYFLKAIVSISIGCLMLTVALHETVFALDPPNNLREAETANHFFTKLPLTSKGWTDIEAMTSSGYSSARVVFVDATSGNDGTGSVYDIGDVSFDSNGIPQMIGSLNAYRTIAAAYSQMRDGYSDILLLKRGETWTSALPRYVNSGSAQSTPHIIASYGTGDRPILSGVGLNSRDADYVLISSIKFSTSDWTNAGRGVDVRGNPTYQTFEDLVFSETAGDIVQGQSGEFAQYIAFRRCIWTHNEAHDGQLYVQQGNHILIEECFFHEPYDSDYTDKSRFGRFFYFTTEGTSGPSYHDYLNNVIMRGNIFYNGERGAVDLRSGGEFSYNLVVASDYNYFGGRGGSENTVQSVDISYNVFLQGPPNVKGYNNIHLINIDGGTVSENILSDNTNIGVYGSSISLNGDAVTLYIARNIDVSDNIVYGRASEYAFTTDSAFTDVQSITISNNDFQLVNGGRIVTNRTWDSGAKRFEGYTYSGNRYHSTNSSSRWFVPGGSYADWVTASGETGSISGQVSYTAPTRTIGSYHSTLGGAATTAAFMSGALVQSRTNWNTSYTAVVVNNHIRTGFDKDVVSYSY